MTSQHGMERQSCCLLQINPTSSFYSRLKIRQEFWRETIIITINKRQFWKANKAYKTQYIFFVLKRGNMKKTMLNTLLKHNYFCQDTSKYKGPSNFEDLGNQIPQNCLTVCPSNKRVHCALWKNRKLHNRLSFCIECGEGWFDEFGRQFWLLSWCKSTLELTRLDFSFFVK